MNSDLITRLTKLASMPDAEIRSRVSAAGELKQGLNAAITALNAADAMKQSSPEMSTLASQFLHRTGEQTHEGLVLVYPGPDEIDEVLRDARSLAATVLSLDQTPGQGDSVRVEMDIPQDAIDRALRDAQNQGQAKPITETVPVVVRPPADQKVTSLNTNDLEGNEPLRDEGDMPLDGQ